MSNSPNGTATESSCETLLGVAASGVLIVFLAGLPKNLSENCYVPRTSMTQRR